MNQFIRSLLTAAGLLVLAHCHFAVSALAQPHVLPLDFSQSDTPFNYLSQRGVPISTVTNVPRGSDGRMPTNNASNPSLNLKPTTNQFQGFISFGFAPGLTNGAWQVASNSALLRGTNAFSGRVAQD